MSRRKAAGALLRSNWLFESSLSPARQLSPRASLSVLDAPFQSPLRKYGPSRLGVRYRGGAAKHREIEAEREAARVRTLAERRMQKGKPADSGSSSSTSSSSSSDSASSSDRPKPNPEEPFDMADLQHNWARVAERFGATIQQLRTGGRFNTDILGAIPVRPDRKLLQTVALRDVATVVPKGGRRWSILCYDPASKTAVKSAFLNSPDFNQQPQDSEDNEAELIVTIEPEKTEDLERRVKEACNAWKDAIRTARAARDKVHVAWKGQGIVGTDDKKKLEKMLQTLQDAQMQEVKKKETEALLHLKQRR